MKLKVFLSIIFIGISNMILFPSTVVAQTEYFREGFDTTSTFSTDINNIAPKYSVGTSKVGTWYGNGAVITVGGVTNSCIGSIPTIGRSHIRLRSTVASPDTAYLITPVLDFGIANLNFIAGRFGRTFTIWTTTDTLATTTSWTLIKAFKPDTCILAPNLFTTVAVNSVNAKRLKIQGKGDADFDSVWITSINPILPVSFTKVTATISNGMARVSWEIGSELNTIGYEIEKSVDGKNFKTEGSIKSNNANKYSWIDAAILSKLFYYRIKAINKDGNFCYSNVIKVNATKTPELAVYPNPVMNRLLNVQISNFNKGNFQLNLIATNGQVVYTKSVVCDAGVLALSIALPNNVEKGIYQLLLTDGQTNNSKTISIQ